MITVQASNAQHFLKNFFFNLFIREEIYLYQALTTWLAAFFAPTL